MAEAEVFNLTRSAFASTCFGLNRQIN